MPERQHLLARRSDEEVEVEWNVNDLWPRLEVQLRIHAPELTVRLRPGASEDELVEYESEIGRRLPEDLRRSYLRHDGCEYLDRPGKYSAEGLLGWYQWMPLNESMQEWRRWVVSRDSEDPYFSGSEEDAESWSGLRIRPWQDRPSSWIPVARMLGASPRLYVDLLPGPAGTNEQLIFVDWGAGMRVEATTWDTYLMALTEGLEQGTLEMFADPLVSRSYWRVIGTEEPFRAPGYARDHG